MNLLKPDHKRMREQAYADGQRETRARIEALFVSWATTHPDAVVRDELWGFVDKMRGDCE